MVFASMQDSGSIPQILCHVGVGPPLYSRLSVS
jgi:hypothetical protein